MVEKILVVGPSWVGDMVMAQSLFKLLKQNNPSLTIHVLAGAWTFTLLSRMKEVDESIELPFTHGELKLRSRFTFAKKLRADRYDQAIILPNSLKAALIPWFAHIPLRTGYLGEHRYLLINDIHHLNKSRHSLMIEQFMALGIAPRTSLPPVYPVPEFDVSKETQEATLKKYRPIFRGNPILALCPGAEFGPAKRWPENYYAEVANAKLASGWDVWLFGSKKDLPITEKMMELTKNRCENLAGRIDLSETIDLFSLVDYVISNDSGLMHVASALKKPVIAIYGSTSPAFTPPLANNAQILKLNLSCQPCFKRTCPLGHYLCLRDLTPDKVLTAMQ